MAERRMFAKTIIDSDAFLDMPMTTQCLYFHLSMRADDEGFINNPKRIEKMIGASDDDLKLLIAKSFLIAFETGVVVIKHWKIHNYIRNDRFKETVYQDERSCLEIKENGSYTIGIPNGYQMDTTGIPTDIPNGYPGKDRLGKDSIGKVSLGKSKDKPPKHTYGEYKHVLLTDDELIKLEYDYGSTETSEAITYLDEYIEMKGAKYKSHYLVMRKWVFDAVKEHKPKESQSGSAFVDRWMNALEEVNEQSGDN